MVDGKKMLFTANVGDSRAVLCRGGKAHRLTIDHKASLPEEAKRIRDAGGFIGRNKRVNGVLAISRALGDHMLKNCGGGLNDVVSAEPYCSDMEITPEDGYVLLACDGVVRNREKGNTGQCACFRIRTDGLSLFLLFVCFSGT
jgi:protein phosphatase PTC1